MKRSPLVVKSYALLLTSTATVAGAKRAGEMHDNNVGEMYVANTTYPPKEHCRESLFWKFFPLTFSSVPPTAVVSNAFDKSQVPSGPEVTLRAVTILSAVSSEQCLHGA